MAMKAKAQNKCGMTADEVAFIQKRDGKHDTFRVPDASLRVVGKRLLKIKYKLVVRCSFRESASVSALIACKKPLPFVFLQFLAKIRCQLSARSFCVKNRNILESFRFVLAFFLSSVL